MKRYLFLLLIYFLIILSTTAFGISIAVSPASINLNYRKTFKIINSNNKSINVRVHSRNYQFYLNNLTKQEFKIKPNSYLQLRVETKICRNEQVKIETISDNMLLPSVIINIECNNSRLENISVNKEKEEAEEKLNETSWTNQKLRKNNQTNQKVGIIVTISTALLLIITYKLIS